MLPADLQAEADILGAVVLKPACLNDVVALVGEDDFYAAHHQAVFRSLVRLAADGKPIDVTTLELDLRTANEIALVGGISGVTKLTERYHVVHAVLQLARRVKDVAALRRVVVAAMEVAEDCGAADALREPTEWVERAAHRMATAAKLEENHEAVHVSTIVRDVVRDLESRKKGERAGLSVEWPQLEFLLRGFRPGQMIVIAARPGVGKTAIALDMARHLTRKAHTGLLFSLEMNRDELGDRLIAAESTIDTFAIESGRLGGDAIDSVFQAADRLSRFALYIDDQSALPIHVLTARARAFDARRRLSFVMIDYLQLIRPSRRGHSRESEVAEISGGLKALAKDLRVPVIVLAQFNRDAEDREPRMSDLRESGAIEQDCDKLIGLHPVPPNKGEEDAAKKSSYRPTKALVLKNRRGPTGEALLTFHGRTTTFKQVDP